MKFSHLLIAFHLVFVAPVYSQRKTDVNVKGASLNYQPISISGIPNCNYNNSDLTLFFNDEFSGNVLDTNKWHSRYSWGPANSDSSDAWCDPNEILLTGNSVKLGCNKKPNNNVLLDGQIISRDYGVGVISTKQTFNYGYYEIRCKIPQIAELWPAFWMIGHCAQEIDVFEFLGSNCRASKPQAFHDPLWACSPF
ncbi:MAG: glycoside hydrolase family 16 protein, partial [Bacteroidia bacterium]